MVRLAMKYQPATHALLGTILCDLGRGTLTERNEKVSQSPEYRISGVSEVLSSASALSIR